MTSAIASSVGTPSGVTASTSRSSGEPLRNRNHSQRPPAAPMRPPIAATMTPLVGENRGATSVPMVAPMLAAKMVTIGVSSQPAPCRRTRATRAITARHYPRELPSPLTMVPRASAGNTATANVATFHPAPGKWNIAASAPQATVNAATMTIGMTTDPSPRLLA